MKVLIINAAIWQWLEAPNIDARYSKEYLSSIDAKVVNGCSIEINEGIVTKISTSNVEIPVTEHGTIIDAKGALVLPGLIDSHIHVGMLGESQHYVNLAGCSTVEDIREALIMKENKEPELNYIVGFNWDQEALGRMPSRNDLDDLFPHKPVFLWRACWHIGVANTAALHIANILISVGKDAKEDYNPSVIPPGGEVEVDCGGRLTGILKERAVEPLVSALGKFKDHGSKLRFLREGLKICVDSGLTMVQTNDEHCYDAYRQLLSEDSLPVRVSLTPNQSEIDSNCVLDPLDPFSSLEANSPESMASRLSIHRLKMFSDGSLGAATAAIKTDQTGSGYKGILILGTDEMEQKIIRSTQRGFRLEVHAIGDAAAEQVVGAWHSAGEKMGNSVYRPILTHCQVLSEAAISKMAADGVIANVQPSFVPTDMRWISSRINEQQRLFSYAWRTLLRAGVWVAGGSDAPIESPNPFTGLYDAIHRTDLHRLASSSEKSSVFRPEECLTLPEAVWLYTIGGALASGLENLLGRIEEGYIADLVFVDSQILSNLSLLHGLKPYMVMVGGQVVSISPNSVPVLMKTESKSIFSRDEKDLLLSTTTVDHLATIEESGASYIPGRGGWFQEPQSIGYCPCFAHLNLNYCFDLSNLDHNQHQT